MQIRYKLFRATLYIYLSGELDNYSSQSTIQTLDNIIDDNLFVKSVIFNFAEVSFMDSTALGVILGRYKKLSSLKISMYIESPTFQADRILELSGVYSIIPKY